MVCYSRSLDTFNVGMEVSSTLGTRVLQVRVILLLTTALITAVIVSAIGAVGFVGLVIPHITRMIAGHRHLLTIPVAFLAGCHFMILADLLSRTLISHQGFADWCSNGACGRTCFCHDSVPQPGEMIMHVVVDKLSVTLQARRVLSDISFVAQRSQTVGLLGP